MVSKNVRVDSLFLDEGFGTLDEEVLDTALKTLVGLHRDGKLIGMISHVPALKERHADKPSLAFRRRVTASPELGIFVLRIRSAIRDAL